MPTFPIIPQLVIFPAYDKNPPYRSFDGVNFYEKFFIPWVQEQASIKFSLPDMPHLDPLERAHFLEQDRALAERKYKEKMQMAHTWRTHDPEDYWGNIHLVLSLETYSALEQCPSI